MHDPMTVAFEILSPFREKPSVLFPHGYRAAVVTIWHKDPERDGSDDSCMRGRAFAWRGWRWHFWHWRFQVHFIQDLKRWLFSRCGGCRKRFSWGYAPVSHNWDSGGPRWFKREHYVYHHECEKQMGSPERN